MFRMIVMFVVLSENIRISHNIRPEEDGKHLNNNFQEDYQSRRRRPSSGASGCNFNGGKGGRYKSDATGRTFFDLAFLNVGYNYQYNINCGQPGGGAGIHPNEGVLGGHKPALGGHKPGLGGHKPGLGAHKPGLGGHKPIFGGHKPGLGGHEPTGDSGDHSDGFLPHRPILSMILTNKPLQTLFGQSSSQSGIFGDVISSVAGLLPTPQQFGQGLGDGITSFVQTIPQIGQSFQSLLPNFGDFQFPNLPSLLPDPYNNRLRPGYGSQQYYFNRLKQNPLNRINYPRQENRREEEYGFRSMHDGIEHRQNKDNRIFQQRSFNVYSNDPKPFPYIRKFQEDSFNSRISDKQMERRQGRPFIFPS
ncbi:uncharacterized protein isoform X5 [Leptinotarsa decemlineata]|uniref:uncharacterized protein isoform X5 n=1 Tax=Leptinotarsa decemlineata TaxID=7539 RepID=UPI003D3093B4